MARSMHGDHGWDSSSDRGPGGGRIESGAEALNGRPDSRRQCRGTHPQAPHTSAGGVILGAVAVTAAREAPAEAGLLCASGCPARSRTTRTGWAWAPPAYELVMHGHEVIVESGAGLGSPRERRGLRRRGLPAADGRRGLGAGRDDREGEGAAARELRTPEEGAKILFTYLHLAADRDLTRRSSPPAPPPSPTRPSSSPTAPCRCSPMSAIAEPARRAGSAPTT